MFIKNKKIEDYLNKSNYIKNNLDLVKRNNIKYDIKIKDDNFWGKISQPKNINIDRTSTKFNSLKSQILNSNKIIENEKFSSTKIINISKIKFSQNTIEKLKTIKNKNELPNKQKKFQPILEMPFVEIPDDDLNKNNKENEEIKQLRKEKIELILAKEEELRKLKIRK